MEKIRLFAVSVALAVVTSDTSAQQNGVHLPVISILNNIGVLMCERQCRVRLNCCYYKYSEDPLHCVLFGVACSEVKTSVNECSANSKPMRGRYEPITPSGTETKPKSLQLACTMSRERENKKLEKEKAGELENEAHGNEIAMKNVSLIIKIKPNKRTKDPKLIVASTDGLYLINIANKSIDYVIPGRILNNQWKRRYIKSEIQLMTYDVTSSTIYYYHEDSLNCGPVYWSRNTVGKEMSVAKGLKGKRVMAVVVDEERSLVVYVTSEPALYKVNFSYLTGNRITYTSGLSLDIDTTKRLIYYSLNDGIAWMDYKGNKRGEDKTRVQGIIHIFQGRYVYWCSHQGMMVKNMEQSSEAIQLQIDNKLPCRCPAVARFEQELFLLCYLFQPQIWIFDFKTHTTAPMRDYINMTL